MYSTIYYLIKYMYQIKFKLLKMISHFIFNIKFQTLINIFLLSTTFFLLLKYFLFYPLYVTETFKILILITFVNINYIVFNSYIVLNSYIIFNSYILP